MAKGLCCAVQAQGGLGKPIQLTIHNKDGSTTQRCGVCEVAPSCSNPQKRVFRFRFLKGIVCGLAGAGKCGPTPAGVAQYANARATAAATGSAIEYEDTQTGPGITFAGPYPSLPIPGAGAPSRVTYQLP